MKHTYLLFLLLIAWLTEEFILFLLKKRIYLKTEGQEKIDPETLALKKNIEGGIRGKFIRMKMKDTDLKRLVFFYNFFLVVFFLVVIFYISFKILKIWSL